jgi:hypothetical protein
MKRLFFAEVGSPGLGRLFLSCVVVLGIYGGGKYKNHTNDNGPSKISVLQIPICAYHVPFELSQICGTLVHPTFRSSQLIQPSSNTHLLA